MASNNIVQFNHVTLNNEQGEPLFDNISFTLSDNEKLFILGHNDKERTKILYAILGLEKPVKGEIILFKKKLNQQSRLKLYQLRKRIGFVHAQKGLLKHYNIFENIALPLQFNSRIAELEIYEKTLDIIHQFNLSEYMNKNSWGMNNFIIKKVLIARAIINNPQLLLIDEPTTYIEKQDTNEIIQLINSVTEKPPETGKMATIITSENSTWAKRKADKILYLNEGKMEYFGPAKAF